MTFHDDEMISWENHGTQLRMVTDELVGATDILVADSRFALIAAEDLLADIIAARIKQRSIRE